MEALPLRDEPGLAGEPLPLAPEWWEQAACAGMDVELFFAEDVDSVAEARVVCAGCPVADVCRRWALARPWLDAGIFGGLTAPERRSVRAGDPPIDRPNRPARGDAPPGEPPSQRPAGEPPPPSPTAVQRQPAPCGTPAAYARHRRRGEAACDACREAQCRKSADAHQRRRQQASESAAANG